MNKFEQELELRLKRVEQLELQFEKRNQCEIKKQKSSNSARLIKIGEIVETVFPEVAKFQPKPTRNETELEFKPFKEFLELLAEDEEFTMRIKAFFGSV